MNARLFRVAASLALAGAIVACVVDPLNPQPLPPSNEDKFGEDGGATQHTPDGSLTASPTVSEDAGTNLDASPPSKDDGGHDAGADADAGDADSGHP
jgi:hypothetical protein